MGLLHQRQVSVEIVGKAICLKPAGASGSWTHATMKRCDPCDHSHQEPLQCVMSTVWLNGHWHHQFRDTTTIGHVNSSRETWSTEALSIRSQVFSSQVAWNTVAMFENAVKSANPTWNCSLWPKDQRDQYWVAFLRTTFPVSMRALRKTTGVTSINQHQL